MTQYRLIDRLQSLASSSLNKHATNVIRQAIMHINTLEARNNRLEAAYKLLKWVPEGKHLELIKNLTAKVRNQRMELKMLRRQTDAYMRAMESNAHMYKEQRVRLSMMDSHLSAIKRALLRGDVVRAAALLEEWGV